jgi:hypothetical protein
MRELYGQTGKPADGQAAGKIRQRQDDHICHSEERSDEESEHFTVIAPQITRRRYNVTSGGLRWRVVSE